MLPFYLYTYLIIIIRTNYRTQRLTMIDDYTIVENRPRSLYLFLGGCALFSLSSWLMSISQAPFLISCFILPLKEDKRIIFISLFINVLLHSFHTMLRVIFSTWMTSLKANKWTKRIYLFFKSMCDCDMDQNI